MQITVSIDVTNSTQVAALNEFAQKLGGLPVDIKGVVLTQKGKTKAPEIEDDDDDEVPPTKTRKPRKPRKPAPEPDIDDEDDEEDEMPAKKKPAAKPKRKPEPDDDDEEDEDEDDDPVIDLDALRTLTGEASRAGHREEMEEWLAKRGASRATDLDPKYYEKYHVFLKSLIDG